MTGSNNLRLPRERNYQIEHIAIGSDVRVSETTLVGDQCVPWHWHTDISDIFYCLEGMVLIQVKDQAEDVRLAVGKSHQIKAGLEHRVKSADGGRCRFLLVQGVGKSDFNLSDQ